MRRTINFKLILGLLGGFLVAAVAVHFLHGYQVSRNAYRLRELGDRASDAKQFDKAVNYYALYLTFVPNDADASQKYAQAFEATGGDSVRLLLLMEQVLRVKPNEHDFRLRLVHNLIDLGRLTEAMDHLGKLRDRYRDKAEILHMLGWCRDANKEYEKAIKAFEDAVAIDPARLKSYALWAEVLNDRLNDPDEARRVLDDMVAKNDKSWQAHLTRARFQRRRGDDKAAQADLERAHQLAPDQAEVLLDVADGARARGDWAEAVKLLQEGAKRFPDNPRFYIDLAGAKLQKDNHADAIAHLKDGLKQTPQSNELAVMLIDLMIEQKQYDDAQVRIAELIERGMKPALPNYLKARLLAADRQWSDAAALVESVRRDLGTRSEWSGRANVLLGICYRRLGDHDQELQAFRRAVENEPNWVGAGVGLGEALLNNGRLDEASQTLEALKKKQVPAGYWTLLARVRLFRQFRVVEADRRWDSVEAALTEADQSQIDVALMRAEIAAAKREYDAAVNILEEARKKRPQDITLWCALADLAVRQDRFADAEKLLEQTAAQPEFAERIEWRLALSRVWGRRGTPEDFVRLTRLPESLPAKITLAERARLLRELADVWQRLGDAHWAERFMRDVARTLPRDLRSRVWLFDAAIEKGRIDDARAWLKDIRTIDGDTGAWARYGDAALLVQEARGRRAVLDEARKKLQEADALHKNWSRVALLSASISEQEGKTQQAIEEYSRALEQGETQPRVLMNVLRLLIDRRDFSKAENEINRYEQKTPLTKALARVGAEVALQLRDKRYARIALNRAEYAVGSSPRDYREALWLARFAQAAAEVNKAETLLRGALESAAQSSDVWIAWIGFLGQNQRRAEAFEELERLKREFPTARQTLVLARCYDALNAIDQAEKAYQNAVEEAPNDAAAWHFAADFSRRAERWEDAQRRYERLLELTNSAEAQAPIRRQLAVVHGQRGAAAKGLVLITGDTHADQRVRHFLKSQTPASRANAIRQFEDTLRTQPASADERILLAQMYQAANQLDRTHAQLSELAAEFPNAPHFLVRHARLLIQMEELQDAERVIIRLETLEPGSERVREVRAAWQRAKN